MWREIVGRAFHRTLQFWGWGKRTLLLPILYAGGFVGFGFWRGWTAAIEQVVITLAFGLIPIAGLSFVSFFVFIYREANRLRIQQATELQEVLLREGKDDRMKTWLTTKLGRPPVKVKRVLAFGSVVHNYETRDMDIVVQFASNEEREIRRQIRLMKRISKAFYELFEHKIHFQYFLAEEDEKVAEFIVTAGQVEVLAGGALNGAQSAS